VAIEKQDEAVTSSSSLGTLGSVASLSAASINHENNQLWTIV
jgi:hypothetical protein